MDRKKVAKELVKLAKTLTAGGGIGYEAKAAKKYVRSIKETADDIADQMNDLDNAGVDRATQSLAKNVTMHLNSADVALQSAMALLR